MNKWNTILSDPCLMHCNNSTQKNFWGADRKIPRSLIGNRNFPISNQLLVQFGQILPVLDQFLVQYGQYGQIWPVLGKNLSKLDQKLVWSRKIAFFHFGPRHFPVDAPKNVLSVFSIENQVKTYAKVFLNHMACIQVEIRNNQFFFKFWYFAYRQVNGVLTIFSHLGLNKV